MALTNPARRVARGRDHALGPELTFGAAVLTAFAALAGATAMLPPDGALALVSALLLVLAGLVALVAWRRAPAPQARLTYWDVAGALTFIGLAAGALVDPEQMTRLIETAHREP
jgi:hypothetical protein